MATEIRDGAEDRKKYGVPSGKIFELVDEKYPLEQEIFFKVMVDRDEESIKIWDDHYGRLAKSLDNYALHRQIGGEIEEEDRKMAEDIIEHVHLHLDWHPFRRK